MYQKGLVASRAFADPVGRSWSRRSNGGGDGRVDMERRSLGRPLVANAQTPHGEVLAAHHARREFSDRRTASLEPRTTQIANSLSPYEVGEQENRCISVVRGSRLGRGTASELSKAGARPSTSP